MQLYLDKKTITISNGIVMIDSEERIIIKKLPTELGTDTGKSKGGKFFINGYSLNFETGDWEKGKEILKGEELT